MHKSKKKTRSVKNPYRLTVNFKSGLFVFAIVIIFAVMAYTQYVVERLREDSRHLVRIYTQLIARIGQEDPEGEYTFMFDQVIKRLDFPIVNTDPKGMPLSWKNIKEIPGDTLTAVTTERLKQIIAEMDKGNEPIPILFQTTTLGYIHYDTDTKLIRQMAWLPVVSIAVVGAFILIGYIGFSNIKRSEQRSIWIGMAKETAHQLGTPISSLMGWLELMKQEADGRESMLKIISEMEVDLKRVDKVVSRFSQIGSSSDLKPSEVAPLVKEIVQYFRKRLPQLGKKIVIEEDYGAETSPYLNPQLFGWVVENVVKNAVDAIENREGIIKLSLSRNNGNVYLDVTDNGRGIELKDHYNVFRPGFSTKKRGWGLGLSLAKRIIEDYHHGKIFVKESAPGQGTTIRIQLKEN